MSAVLVERADHVVTVTLNRPHRKNALDSAMWHELEAALRDVAGRPEDRVLVLTGAGGAFCSGADLDLLDAIRTGHPTTVLRTVTEVVLALHRLPKPTIAKVRGAAAGAGANLALGCDLVVAAEDARFSQLFINRALSAEAGGSWLLPRLVGLHKAKELLFFGDTVSAADAARIGFVNHVCAVEEVDRFVSDWAARLARVAPVALSMTKELLNESAQNSMERALVGESRATAINLAAGDFTEAMAAFEERRPAVYRGR